MNNFKSTPDTYEAERKILSSSFLLRLRKKDSRWLISSAITHLPNKPWRISENSKSLIVWNLGQLLTREIRDTYGNPLVIFMLVRVILPIIIQLVIKWWLNQIPDTRKGIASLI